MRATICPVMRTRPEDEPGAPRLQAPPARLHKQLHHARRERGLSVWVVDPAEEEAVVSAADEAVAGADPGADAGKLYKVTIDSREQEE